MTKEQEFYEQLRDIVTKYHVVPDYTPLARIVKLGARLAQRHLSGQVGAGMDKDAQAIIDQVGELPFELRELL